MNRFTNSLIVFVLIFQMVNILSNTPIWAQTLRNPAYAGSFYPADADKLRQTIENLAEKAARTPVDLPDDKELKALILPHAGYIYSGLTAAHAVHVLRKNQFSKVILMGPDHRVGFSGVAVSNVNAYVTPLGNIRLSRDAENLLNADPVFKSVPLSDRKEHSLEVILPFLQYFLPEFELVPMVMGPGDFRKYTRAVESVTDEKTLLVASSDLSHYLAYDDAVAMDRDTIDKILTLKTSELLEKPHCACGKIPILILMNMAERHGWEPILLHYSNSGDTAGTRDKVVGYAAIAFYGDKPMKDQNTSAKEYTEEQGQLLVRLARKTIADRLGKSGEEPESLDAALKSDVFQKNRGTFVTLKKHGQLRGCIGSLSANEPVAESVRHNAINAAFHDPRFQPLSENELDQVEVEVSILSEPKPLAYEDADDLIAKLRVNIDGVILRKGYHSATFLPQVWEQLPKPEDFLSHLCRKAGLPGDAWRTSKLEISTYQVEYFEEK